MRPRNRFELLNPGEFSFVGALILEAIAIDDFHRPISAHDVARQPDLAVAATANGSDQFVVGYLRWRTWRSRASRRAIQRRSGRSDLGHVVLHKTFSSSSVFAWNLHHSTVKATRNGAAKDMLETKSMLTNSTSGRGFSRVLL